MRQVLWPISVVIALVAGVVIGFALKSSGTGPRAAPEADTRSGSTARQPNSPVAPAVPAEEESLPLADESSADLRQGGAQISEALLANLFPTGDAAICGEVRTADGEPLPGVKISARRMSKPQFEERLAGWNRQHADQLDTLDEAERDRISGLAMRMWADDGEFSAVTGADGTYRIEGLAKDAFVPVTASAEGYIVYPADRVGTVHEASSHHVGRRLDFVAMAGWTVEVSVRYDDGSYPEAAMVNRLEPDGTSHGSGVKPGTPLTLRLTRGITILTASVFGHPDSIEHILDTREKAPPAKFEITIPRGISVSGSVNATGDLAEQVNRIGLMPLEGPEQFDPERVGTIEYSGRGATTAYLSPSGAFEFTGVKPGRYALYATDGVSTSWEELQVTGNMNDVVLDVPTTSTSEGILVRLTTLAAPRMFNNSFSVRDASLPPKRIDVTAVPVNRVSWLLVPKDAGVSAPPYDVTIRLAQREFRRSARALTGDVIELSIDEPAVVMARIGDPGGYTHAWSKSVTIQRSEGKSSPQTLRKAGSMWACELFETGDYVITLSFAEREHPRIYVVQETLQIEAGSTTVWEPAIPALHRLVIVNPAETAASKVSLKQFLSTGERGVRVAVAAGKQIEIGYMPAGSYRIEYEVADETRTKAFTVPGTAELFLD